MWELPPRTRRIQGRPGDTGLSSGTTSAHAENTILSMRRIAPGWNYLRARGEYSSMSSDSYQPPELPPRARRIPHDTQAASDKGGTTSACAENTHPRGRWGFFRRNYLRVRGEYGVPVISRRPGRELPPRARRIPINTFLSTYVVGTTSACAENTTTYTTMKIGLGNYLRVRGEYAYQQVFAPEH